MIRIALESLLRSYGGSEPRPGPAGRVSMSALARLGHPARTTITAVSGHVTQFVGVARTSIGYLCHHEANLNLLYHGQRRKLSGRPFNLKLLYIERKRERLRSETGKQKNVQGWQRIN